MLLVLDRWYDALIKKKKKKLTGQIFLKISKFYATQLKCVLQENLILTNE